MPNAHDRFARCRFVLWGFPLLMLLGGCEPKPECDTIDNRNAVLRAVSEDRSNPLVAFAARNSDVKAFLQNRQPLYLLGEKIVTTATNNSKRTLQCRGAMSVAIGDIKATKEIEFSVQQSPDGKVAVSIFPFQF